MARKVVVLGTGGHAKVIVDILEQEGEFEVAGFTSNDKEFDSFFGYPVFGDDTVLQGLFKDGIRLAFVAVGDNRIRAGLFRKVSSLGYSHINAISSKASISRRAVLGVGTAVMPGGIINADARVGDGVVINTGATVDHDCEIAQFSHLAPGVHLGGNVSIGEGTLLGIGCSIIPETNIGSWTVIGAGSVVISELPSNVIATGVPVRTRREGEER